MKKLCAITISAYKCKDYIMECINSIKSQEIPEDWDIDLRIGVDGCQETSDILIKNNIPHYWSDENVGTYIIRNSLIYIKPADVYIYFDADDVMLDGYIEENIHGALNHTLFMSRKINTNEELIPLKTCNLIDEGRGGAMSFTHNLLTKLGGYHSFRCSSDCDFVNRAKRLEYIRVLSEKQLYYRRRHKNSLTLSPETKVNSSYRNEIVKTMKTMRDSGMTYIKPEIIVMKHINRGNVVQSW